MTDFLDQYLALKEKVKEAGSELTISIVIPEVNSEYLYSVRRLSDSDDPADWIKSISDYVETDEYLEALLVARSAMSLRKLDKEVDADLRDIKIEVTAVDLFYFANLAKGLQAAINLVHKTNNVKFEYTKERYEKYMDDVFDEQYLTETARNLLLYKKDRDDKEEAPTEEISNNDDHPV